MIRTQDTHAPLLFSVGYKVWLHSKRTSKNKSAKLLPKFIGTFLILQVEKNHIYPIEQKGRVSRESESRLKAFYESVSAAGKAPRTEEHYCLPTRRGMTVGRKRRSAEMSDLRELLDEHRDWLDAHAAVHRHHVPIAQSPVGQSTNSGARYFFRDYERKSELH